MCRDEFNKLMRKSVGKPTVPLSFRLFFLATFLLFVFQYFCLFVLERSCQDLHSPLMILFRNGIWQSWKSLAQRNPRNLTFDWLVCCRVVCWLSNCMAEVLNSSYPLPDESLKADQTKPATSVSTMQLRGWQQKKG